MKLLCEDILIVPSHGPLNNPSFPNCVLSVFLQNNEVPPFIWTLEYHLCLWLSCYGDTFCSCMLSPFLIVSPAKFGPLEYLPCPVSRLAVSVIHSHGHSAVGFVLSGLTIFTFLPKLCCRPNPCSSPGPIWSTQTQKKKITTKSQNKGGAGGDFSKPRPWRRELRKTDSTFTGVRMKRDTQDDGYYTPSHKLSVPEVSSPLFIPRKTVRLRHSFRAFWDNMGQHV